MNIWDIAVLAAVGILTAAAICMMLRNRKKGCRGCCASCGHACDCGVREKKVC